MKTRYAQIADWITLDGSRIRELMHPGTHGNAAQSLAEATIEAGGRTRLHQHRSSEELYHVSAGSGWMWLERCWLRLERGDTVCIPPASAHCVQADAGEALVLLCCCSPAYSHEDTELLPDHWPATDPPEERR
jgi:mannose-6-phosphate isomerase-like protein (cupin superfamily)